MPVKNVKSRALVQMLSCLDRKQLKAFQEYLSCSLFNTNPTLVKLLTCLESKALDEKVAFLDHEELLKGSGIKVSSVDKLCSNLLNHLNRFVPLWAERNDARSSFATTLDAWYRMGLKPDVLEREYRKMKRKLSKMSASEFDLIDELKLEHIYAQYRVSQPRRDQNDLFETHQRLLDQFYWISKLKYQCAALSAGTVFGNEGAGQLEALDSLEVQELPLIGQAYYAAQQLLTAEDLIPGEAERFFAFMEHEGRNLSNEDRSDLYGYLLNSCIRRMNQGNPSMEHLVHRVYDAWLGHGLLTMAGWITSSHFKNILSIKLKVKALEGARAFVESYGKLLPEDEQDLLLAYAHGMLAFHSGRFTEAIRHFKALTFDPQEDLFLNLETRNMLWKSYFEAYEELSPGEHTEMLKLYDSFRIFVARSTRISEHRRLGYQNFIRHFNRLIQIGDKKLWVSSVPELLALQKETDNADHIVNKDWLLGAIQRRIEKQQSSGLKS